MIIDSLKRIFQKKTNYPRNIVESRGKIERILNHNFNNPALLQQALTHRSFLHETSSSSSQSNELLEFLGDAVLGFVVVEELYNRFPDKTEGELSKLKSMLVSGNSLQGIAHNQHIGDFILMSQNEAANGGRTRRSILEDTFEAIIAAIYLDSGMSAARRFIVHTVLSNVDQIVHEGTDTNFKSQLLEYAQARGLRPPEYQLISEQGPDHEKQFEIQVLIGKDNLGTGSGRTKKAAQQKAARNAVYMLNTSKSAN